VTLNALKLSLALLLLPSLALANDGLAGRYELKGDHSKRGEYTSKITITSEDGALKIERRAAFAHGPEEIGLVRVSVSPAQRRDLLLGQELRLVLPGKTQGGMAAIVAGGESVTSSGPLVRFQLSDPAKHRCHVRIAYPDGATAEAWGQKVGADDRRDSGALAVLTKGGLKRALKSELKKALRSGVSLDETLKLSDFLHVGLGGEMRVLTREDLGAYQLKSLHEKGSGVWIATEAEGGIRLPFSASIPLGSAGTASVGFAPGVELRYEVVDLYDRPSGGKEIAKTFWKAGKRAFKLPLDAARAEALVPGASRSFEGEFTVAITGSLGIGWDTKEVNDLVEIGASARVGGFYRIRRPMRLEVRRLDKKIVRIHLVRAKEREYGAEARLFAGAALDKGAVVDEIGLEYVEPVVEEVVGEANSVVKKIFRFELSGQIKKTTKDEFEVAYRFDLAKDEARKAYERAVRGDFTLAAFSVNSPTSGVELDFRIFDLEKRIVSKADLTVSLLMDGKLRKLASDKLLDIKDESGQTKYHVFRYNRQRALGLFAFWKKIRKRWDEHLAIEVIRATDVTGLSENEIKFLPWRSAVRTFSFRYVLSDPHTRKSEGNRLRRVLAAMGLDGAAGLPNPKRRLFHSRYGRVQTSLSVDLSERGIRQVMAITTKNQPELERHFKSAYRVVHNKDPKSKLVAKFVENMQGLAKAKPGRSRGEFLHELAEESGWDLTLVTALTRMSPTGVRVHASVDGKRISFEGDHKGKNFQEFNPNLHGH
jgi:hypothetical protein